MVPTLRHTSRLLAWIVLLTPAALVAATPDTTFTSAQSVLEAWLTGGLGKVLVLASLLAGMGVAVATQSQVARLFAMLTALAAAFGPGVITSVFGATL